MIRPRNCKPAVLFVLYSPNIFIHCKISDKTDNHYDYPNSNTDNTKNSKKKKVNNLKAE